VRLAKSGLARSSVVYAVLDANVVVRAIVGEDEKPARWVARVDDAGFVASAPDLIFAEVGQAVLGYLKRGYLSMGKARERLDFVCALPLHVRPTQELVAAAVVVARDRQLCVYDACYAVLAEAEDAVLVTGDRRLADSVTRAELI
jgi:predicted nucleic acid-binding protein